MISTIRRFQHIAPWIVSLQDHERQRAIQLTKDLLTCYLEHIAGNHAQVKGPILWHFKYEVIGPSINFI